MYGIRGRVSTQNAKEKVCHAGNGLSHLSLPKTNNKLAESYGELVKDIMGTELKRVGNYTLTRLIGTGSFGKVYLAYHEFTRSKVVLKSASKSDTHLVREIHHHRQFKHPHIARLYEVVVTESQVWLALEYCPGDELYTYLVKHGRLDGDETRKIFAQLAGAVSYTHSKNCAHRDLKLENILLDRKHNVKLCDFGFTREYEPRSLLETVCGTTCYMAPEMLARKKYSGEAVDVWSLGVILYTLLYGELPFEENSDPETRDKVLHGEPRYPDAGVDAAAVDLVRQMLQKDPKQRISLAQILEHPYLEDDGYVQREILAVPEPRLFSTKTEKRVLRSLRASHVDLASLANSVMAQKCDSLAGLWALAVERQAKHESRSRRSVSATHRAMGPRSASVTRNASLASRRGSGTREAETHDTESASVQQIREATEPLEKEAEKPAPEAESENGIGTGTEPGTEPGIGTETATAAEPGTSPETTQDNLAAAHQLDRAATTPQTASIISLTRPPSGISTKSSVLVKTKTLASEKATQLKNNIRDTVMKVMLVGQKKNSREKPEARHARSQTLSELTLNRPKSADPKQNYTTSKKEPDTAADENETETGLGLRLGNNSGSFDSVPRSPPPARDLGSPMVLRQRPVSQISAFSQLSAYSMNSNVSSTGSLNSIDRMHPKDIVSKLRRPPLDRTSTSSSVSSTVSHKASHRKSSSLASVATDSSPGSSPRSPRHPSPHHGRFHVSHAQSPFSRRAPRGRYNEAAVFTARARSWGRRLSHRHTSEPQTEVIQEDEDDRGLLYVHNEL